MTSSYGIMRILNKIKKELIASTGGILIVIAIVALLCSDFSYTQFEKPHRYTEYTITSNDSTNEINIFIKLDNSMYGKIFAFYTSDSFVDAYIDGARIYHYGEASTICKSPGSLYQMIQMPENIDLDGKTLEIHISTVYENKFTTDYDMYISSSGGWIITKLKQEIFDILANIVLFMLGIIMCVVYALERNNGMRNISNLYLGIASMLTVVWTNCELFIFQLLLPTGVGQYFIYYCTFMILPMLLILYFECMHNREVKYTIELYVHFTTTVIMTILQISGVAEFTQTVSAYLIVCIVELISVVIKSLISKNHMSSKYLTTGLVILVASIVINSIIYLLDTTKHASLIMTKVGFIIYIILSLYSSFEHLMLTMIYEKENKKLNKIAYTDALTKISNRYAFDRDIKTISLEYLYIVSIDLNNLKYFNDNFGHITGDKLIVEATKILREAFDGSIYRTGGDEFIILQAGTNDTTIESEIDKMNKICSQYNNESSELVIEIACGYSGYKQGDRSYEDILRRADDNMYDNKALIKKSSTIKSIR